MFYFGVSVVSYYFDVRISGTEISQRDFLREIHVEKYLRKRIRRRNVEL